MKKIITILFISLNIFVTKANKVSEVVDSTISTVKSTAISTVGAVKDVSNFVDTSSLYKTMYSDLKSGALVLAQTFKTTAEKVFYIIGKKYFLQGIFSWIVVIFCLVFLILIWFKIPKYIKNNPEQHLEILYLPLLVVSFVILTFIYLTLPDAINYTFNPEYYVLQELIDTVKQFKN